MHGVTSAVRKTRVSWGMFRKAKFTLNPSAVPAPSLLRIFRISDRLALDDSNALVMNSRAETSSNTYVDRWQNGIYVLTLNTIRISNCLQNCSAPEKFKNLILFRKNLAFSSRNSFRRQQPQCLQIFQFICNYRISRRSKCSQPLSSHFHA